MINIYPDMIKNLKLKGNALIIYAYLFGVNEKNRRTNNNRPVTTDEIAKKLDIHINTVYATLCKLKEIGLIVEIGNTRPKNYQIKSN